MSIADNLRRVQDRIAAAAESAGRNPADILLVGVTKYVGAEEAAALAAAGCIHLGESRPQELWRQAEALRSYFFNQERAGGSSPPTQPPQAHQSIHWHLIGHLQRNKVRRTLPLVTLIHSIDSERLLSEINAAAAADVNPSSPVVVLLEVNTSGEPAKHGLAPDAVEPLLTAAARFPHVAVRGLMTMAALQGGVAEAARNFAALRELRDRLKRSSPPNIHLNELSMGMSNDFEVAIQEGATIVRVGSLLWE